MGQQFHPMTDEERREFGVPFAGVYVCFASSTVTLFLNTHDGQVTVLDRHTGAVEVWAQVDGAPGVVRS
jgi:hypothetical protein